MEQVRLHQHAAVCGRRSGRAGRGDAHHDVSGAQRKKEKKKIVILQFRFSSDTYYAEID